MAKIFLITFSILAFIIIFVYYYLIITKRFSIKNKKENDEMFLRKPICTDCKTGKETYELDKLSEICPNIACWEDGKCPFYEPLDKT